MTDTALNRFDGIVYINLAIRTDRKKHIEKELKNAGIAPHKIFRIDAHHDELNGCRGCVYSHIKALDFALEKGWKNVLILEDDAVFISEPSSINAYVTHFFDHFKDAWDVFFLGTQVHVSIPTDHLSYIKVHFSLRAHAYVVNGPYMLKLRDHYLSTYRSMENELFYLQSINSGTPLDIRWIDLQVPDRWYVGLDMIAKQKRGYSDIDKRIKHRR